MNFQDDPYSLYDSTIQKSIANAYSSFPSLVIKDPKYECVSCQQIFVAPMQLKCGHRLCNNCYKSMAESEFGVGVINCPNKQDNCESSSLNEIYPDHSARREMKQLLIYCPFQSNGCLSEFPFCCLKDHLNVCNYIDIKCPGNCHSILPKFQFNEHLQTCKNIFVCKHLELGCTYMVKDYNDLILHEENDVCHLNLIFQKTQKIKAKNVDLMRILKEQYNISDQTYEEMLNLECENIKLKQKIEAFNVLENLMMENEDKLNKFNNRMCTSLNIAYLANDGPNKSELEETRQTLITIDKFIGSYNVHLNDLDLRFQCLEQTNYDGMLLWKITNYSRHKNNALMGQTTSLYSQPFFTSRYGYKMCARAYLNGDGIGKGTHVSLFFVLMKGDYDNILEWPFKSRVTMMLLDQSGKENHITDSFQPDPKSSSFQKPFSSFNVASGCPLFATHTKIENNINFLKDDCIFFKLKITS